MLATTNNEMLSFCHNLEKKTEEEGCQANIEKKKKKKKKQGQEDTHETVVAGSMREGEEDGSGC
jgi:hypothetical protein